MSAEERKAELEEFYPRIESLLFYAQLSSWIRKYIGDSRKLENEKLIFQNDYLKQEVRIHKSICESKDQDIAALQENIGRIFGSVSWRFGHGIVSFFRRIFPK